MFTASHNKTYVQWHSKLNAIDIFSKCSILIIIHTFEIEVLVLTKNLPKGTKFKDQFYESVGLYYLPINTKSSYSSNMIRFKYVRIERRNIVLINNNICRNAFVVCVIGTK